MNGSLILMLLNMILFCRLIEPVKSLFIILLNIFPLIVHFAEFIGVSGIVRGCGFRRCGLFIRCEESKPTEVHIIFREQLLHTV